MMLELIRHYMNLLTRRTSLLLFANTVFFIVILTVKLSRRNKSSNNYLGTVTQVVNYRNKLCHSIVGRHVVDTDFILELIISTPGLNFFGKTPLFFRYSGVNAANAVNLQAKRR